MTAFELPAEIAAKLEAAPDNGQAELEKQRRIIDAALIHFYGKKSIHSIAAACGVSRCMVDNRIKKLQAQGRL